MTPEEEKSMERIARDVVVMKRDIASIRRMLEERGIIPRRGRGLRSILKT